MSQSLKKAYAAGYNYGILTKAANSRYKKMLSEEDINRMLIGAVSGGAGGAMIGGRYHRIPGMVGGALLGTFAANPQLFGALVSDAGKGLYNFARGNSGVFGKKKSLFGK